MNKRLLRREQFPITRSLVYLNHAAVGPLSEDAYRAMESHAREQRDVAALHWRDWMREYERFREVAAKLINARSSEISILKNTSEGISFVAEGWDWKAGENVITTDMEFPSNFVPWKRLERRGVECRTITTRDGAFDPDDVRELIDEKTRIVALSVVSFHNGFTPDLETIGRICRERGVLLCIDAIQGLGAIQIDVERCGISFLAADGHKWLLGPEGTAIFYVRDELRNRLELHESGWLNIRQGAKIVGASVDLFEDGRRFEAGSLNTNGVYGLRAAIELLLTLGMDEVEREVIRIGDLLSLKLEQAGCVIRSPRPQKSGIVAVTPPLLKREILDARLYQGENAPKVSGPRAELYQLQSFLESHRIIVSAREGMLRFSPHFYNDERDVEEVVEILRDVIA